MSDEQNTTEEADHIKALREKAKLADQVASEKSVLERKVAILEAGVNTTTPVGAMFLKSYDGELTTEAIKAAAAEVGLVEGQPTPEPEPGSPGSTWFQMTEADTSPRSDSTERSAVTANRSSSGVVAAALFFS